MKHSVFTASSCRLFLVFSSATKMVRAMSIKKWLNLSALRFDCQKKADVTSWAVHRCLSQFENSAPTHALPPSDLIRFSILQFIDVMTLFLHFFEAWPTYLTIPLRVPLWNRNSVKHRKLCVFWCFSNYLEHLVKHFWAWSEYFSFLTISMQLFSTEVRIQASVKSRFFTFILDSSSVC